MPDAPLTPKPLSTRTFPAAVLDRLRGAGFDCAVIAQSPERVRCLKGEVAVVFERTPSGELRLAQAPGYVFRGEIGRLWDAGYQKFWLLGPVTDEPFTEPRRPATAEHLRALHEFSEELKHLLDLPSFYNESIGTTSEVTAYDRVRGRGPSVPTSSH
jgi:hypothetical protein